MLFNYQKLFYSGERSARLGTFLASMTSGCRVLSCVAQEKSDLG